MKKKGKSGNCPNANYDYKKQVEPTVRMGQGEFANMPSRMILKDYDHYGNMRDGVIDSEVKGVEGVSGIDENYR